MNRCPQLTDDVVFTLTLPADTEEWADEELAREFDVRRDEQDRLIVTHRVGGNCNAVACARSFLDEVEDFLRHCDVDPMDFEFRAESQAPTAPVSSEETK